MDITSLKPVTAQIQLTASLTKLYSVIVYSFISIQAIHICNTGAAPITVRLCFTPPNQTAGQTNAALWDFSIGGNDFIEVCYRELLPVGTVIWASASSAGIVNVFLSAVGI